MKNGITSSHQRYHPSNGRHMRYFIMTIVAAYLLALGILVISFVVGANFFN